jgi:hypothetical protein
LYTDQAAQIGNSKLPATEVPGICELGENPQNHATSTAVHPAHYRNTKALANVPKDSDTYAAVATIDFDADDFKYDDYFAKEKYDNKKNSNNKDNLEDDYDELDDEFEDEDEEDDFNDDYNELDDDGADYAGGNWGVNTQESKRGAMASGSKGKGVKMVHTIPESSYQQPKVVVKKPAEKK